MQETWVQFPARAHSLSLLFSLPSVVGKVGSVKFSLLVMWIKSGTLSYPCAWSSLLEECFRAAIGMLSAAFGKLHFALTKI